MNDDRHKEPATDITASGDRNRLTALHDAAGMFDCVFESSTDAMKLVDLDGRIMRWNHAAQELYGWREEEVLGETMPHVPPDLRLRTIHDIRAIAASGQSSSREVVALKKDGSKTIVALTVVPYSDAQGNPAGVVSMGVALASCVDAVSYPDDFCLAFSQTLRPRLTALAGYAQLLVQEDIVEDVPRRTRTVRAIKEHAAAVSELLDDVALVSEVRAGVLRDEASDVELASVVADAVRRAEQSRSGQRIVVDFEPSVGLVRISRHRLERILVRLITLAADRSSGEGSVFVTVSTRGALGLVQIETKHPSRGSSSQDGGSDRDVDTFAWHGARLIVEAYGGAITRSERGGAAAYRMMVPVSADPGQR